MRELESMDQIFQNQQKRDADAAFYLEMISADKIGEYLSENDGVFRFGTRGFREYWVANILCELRGQTIQSVTEDCKGHLLVKAMPYVKARLQLFSDQEDREWALEIIWFLVLKGMYDFPLFTWFYRNYSREAKKRGLHCSKMYKAWLHREMMEGTATLAMQREWAQVNWGEGIDQ